MYPFRVKVIPAAVELVARKKMTRTRKRSTNRQYQPEWARKRSVQRAQTQPPNYHWVSILYIFSYMFNINCIILVVTPHTRCRLKLLKLERVKDYLMMEEEFILNQERLKPQEERNEVNMDLIILWLQFKIVPPNSCLDIISEMIIVFMSLSYKCMGTFEASSMSWFIFVIKEWLIIFLFLY